MLSEHLYIHIPFCKKKCSYCDFFSLPNIHDKVKNEYTKAVIRELKLYSKWISKPLKTLYLGGGSPILLGANNLLLLSSELSEYLDSDTEISTEINPEHLENNDYLLKNLKQIGINRISLGIQSTSAHILSIMERSYDMDKLLLNIEKIKRNKISLSLDFMFATPDQDMKSLCSDLDFIENLKPDHVSFYIFTVSDNYKHIGLCVKEEMQITMLKKITAKLKKLNYKHYEVSNYCLEGKECRHNLSYWKRSSYLGLGAGAHSFDKDGRKRFWNPKDIEHYIKTPGESYQHEFLDRKDDINEEIFLGFRLIQEGVDENILNSNVLNEFIDRQLLKKSGNRVLVTEKGLPLINYISSSFMI